MSFFERIIQEMLEASEIRLKEANLTEQDIRDLIDYWPNSCFEWWRMVYGAYWKVEYINCLNGLR